MIQGYDPRTGKPAGDPVPETDGAGVDAIAEAAAAARVPWEQAGPGGRAAALEAVASALDGAAAELVTAGHRDRARDGPPDRRGRPGHRAAAPLRRRPRR
jgi:NADP-dependent aldehyde dehydrogenase